MDATDTHGFPKYQQMIQRVRRGMLFQHVLMMVTHFKTTLGNSRSAHLERTNISYSANTPLLYPWISRSGVANLRRRILHDGQSCSKHEREPAAPCALELKLLPRVPMSTHQTDAKQFIVTPMGDGSAIFGRFLLGPRVSVTVWRRQQALSNTQEIVLNVSA